LVENWPEHSEELSRKSIEVIEKWSKLYDRGVITKREFYIMISAIYDATSGLITDEMSHLISEIHKDLRAK
jgi:transcriptional regulator CtsR